MSALLAYYFLFTVASIGFAMLVFKPFDVIMRKGVDFIRRIIR